jgi:hypothetical protein
MQPLVYTPSLAASLSQERVTMSCGRSPEKTAERRVLEWLEHYHGRDSTRVPYHRAPNLSI